MEFAMLLDAMNQASGFELYRLRAAIDRVLADPKWIIAIRSQLRIGQEIEYLMPVQTSFVRRKCASSELKKCWFVKPTPGSTC